MKGNLMIGGPRAGSAQDLRDFIAAYEPLEYEDDGVAAELQIARLRLQLREAQEAQAVIDLNYSLESSTKS
jgi:hypothetical protein